MVWDDNPNYIRRFHELKQNYNLLCNEVEFILKKTIEDAEIETASITTRTKTESSFCEKLYRKSYSDPFKEITDFSGARVVYLYSSDKSKLEELIESEFQIIEKVDKVEGAGADQFGYGALHYLVKLKPNYSQVRYPKLKNLCCEIQIRTVLQDAWAIVAHHLSYKQESDIPPHLRRKLNALSGLFETADDQFERIRELRFEYQQSVTNEFDTNTTDRFGANIELDNLKAYLIWKYPERTRSLGSTITEVIHELKQFGYETLQQLDDMLNRTSVASSKYEEEYPPFNLDLDEHTTFADAGIIRVSLELVEPDFLARLPKSAQLKKKKFLEFVQ